VQKLNWSAQIKKMLLYHFNNGKKVINANTILNWMDKALEIQKNNEEKARNYDQDKKFFQKKEIRTPVTVLPEVDESRLVKRETIQRMNAEIARKFAVSNP